MTTHLLADPEARRPGFPAGGTLDFDYAVAVKTGTSQWGHRDAWSVAFSDRLSVVVWVGNHDWRKMNAVSGVSGAAPVAWPHELRVPLSPGSHTIIAAFAHKPGRSPSVTVVVDD